MELTKAAVARERLRRQRLFDPVSNDEDYLELFRLMQPVSPVALSRPGDPPSLTVRATFDDRTLTDRLRRDRIIVKGRFLNGTVGYVFAAELGLYASVFRKPLSSLNMNQDIVFRTVQRSAPITPRQIREETGLMSKQIGPALQRLQQAFLLYEDQIDGDWDRAWYDFPGEWPGVDIDGQDRGAAVAMVVGRFLQTHVFATALQVRDWSRLPVKTVAAAIAVLEDAGSIREATVPGVGRGWVCGAAPETADDLSDRVIMLQKNDILVRSHRTALGERFGDKDTLEILMIGGELRGAVAGRWGFDPYDVQDIILDLPANEAQTRKAEILEVVGQVYHPPRHNILRYAGNPLESA